jgi:O-antigen/teichoic acid export membrane protein
LLPRRRDDKAAETHVSRAGGMIVDRLAISRVTPHPGLSRLVRCLRIPLVLADQGLVSGVNFVSSILLARFLGIEEFGRFTLAGMVVLFANSLHYAAFIQPMLSIGPKHAESETPAYYCAVIVQQAVVAPIAFAVILIGTAASALALPDWGIGSLAVPLAIATLAGQAQDFLRRYLFVRGRTVAAAVNDGIRYLSQLILLCVANRISGGLTVSMAWWIIATAAVLGAAHGALCFEKIAWSAEVFWQTVARHWHVAKWLVPSAFMYLTTGQVFMIMAGAVLGAATVGMLRAAQAVVGVLHILLIGMENFVPIHASQVFYRRGSRALYHYLKRLTWKGGAAVLPLLLLINLNATNIVQLMYGIDYPDLSPLVLGWSILYIVVSLNAILQLWALAIESTQVVFASRAAATVATAMTAYPFVAFGGVAGVFAGILMVNLLLGGIMFTVFNRKASLAANEVNPSPSQYRRF